MATRRSSNSERGFTIVELLVAAGISSLVILGVLSQYSMGIGMNHDHNIRIATVLEAQAVLQTLGSEIRMIGNGVPFEQANFQIGEPLLSDVTVTEPIKIATATATNITFRINETGETYLLTADFDPASSMNLTLTDTAGLDAGDPIYISNSVVSGDDGFYGTIQSISGNTVTLSGTYVTRPGATFNMGSVFEEVPLVTYNSPADGSGITRDSGFGAVPMGSRTTMSLSYLDANGGAVALPLTHQSIVDSLRAIRVTVTKTSSNVLQMTGQPYTASVTQTFGIRNLNYLF